MQASPRFLAGLAIVFGIALSWVGATQLSQATQRDYGDAVNSPLFVVWFSTSTNVALALPALIRAAFGLRRSSAGDVRPARVQEPLLTGADVGWMLVFYGLWTAANYAFTRALVESSASVVTAFMGTTPAWVATLSAFALPASPHASISVKDLSSASSCYVPAAVLLTVAGSVLIASPWTSESDSSSSDSNSPHPLFGTCLSLGSALLAAVYKVYYKKQFGSPSPLRVGCLMCCIGVYSLTIGSLLLLAVVSLHWESVTWAKVPWPILVGSASSSLVFNFLVNYGIAFTYPLFISLGTVVGIPLNVFVDYYAHDSVSSPATIAGMVAICTGFCLVVIADYRQTRAPGDPAPAVQRATVQEGPQQDRLLDT
ncbi:member F3/4 [Diplonema papillatum]|nr:member F3/4 [Diplonema papillatum]